MAKNERTNPRVATLASEALKNKSTNKSSKSIAASALTQAPDKRKKKGR